MAAVTQSAQFSPQHSTTQSSSVQPGHIFSDDELSEIFQIDFGQIFGNPEAGLKSNYKGIQSKRTTQGKKCGLPSVLFSYISLNTKQIYLDMQNSKNSKKINSA